MLACVPIQRRIFSGSVRKAKTVAGGAAIWTSRRSTNGSGIGSLLRQERGATFRLERVSDGEGHFNHVEKYSLTQESTSVTLRRDRHRPQPHDARHAATLGSRLAGRRG